MSPLRRRRNSKVNEEAEVEKLYEEGIGVSSARIDVGAQDSEKEKKGKTKPHPRK
jgi:hypothetical protein